MRLDRSRRAGRYLEWKVRLFTLGAVFAVVGMAVESDWMIRAAIVVLAIGLVLRFLPGGRETVLDQERDREAEDDGQADADRHP